MDIEQGRNESPPKILIGGTPMDNYGKATPGQEQEQEVVVGAQGGSNTNANDSDEEGNPVDCYWLDQDGESFGYCVLVRDGLIIGFRWIKG